MIPKFLCALWGDLTHTELKMFGLLSSALFFIVGAYWMLRVMKNAIFMHTVGSAYLGYAKMISPIVLICLILLYSKLVDYLSKQKLVYIMVPIYAVIFMTISYALAHPALSKSALIGWITYFTVESFASIIVALFWSFVASSMDTVTAKKGYPIILTGAQLGSVLGCILDLNASTIGLPWLFFGAGLSVCAVPFIIRAYVKAYPAEPSHPGAHKPKPTGAFEGLRLLFSNSYLLGILVIATVYETIGTIFDVQMNTLAQQHYGSPASVTEFLAIYGLLANILSFVFALVGTSFLIRRFGLRLCLLLFPAIIGFVVCGVWAFYGLWTLLAAMVMTRGLTYALNNPCKEIMYIPTSRDIRFKTKSWIDTFGSRTAKGLGGFVTTIFHTVAQLANYGTLISLGIVGAWMFVASYVGNTNHKLVQENKTIE